jgi:hypothetical protein
MCGGNVAKHIYVYATVRDKLGLKFELLFDLRSVASSMNLFIDSEIDCRFVVLLSDSPSGEKIK